MSADKCLDPTGCNGGGNARWCGSFTPSPPSPPAPTPPPPPPPQCKQRDGSYTGPACGYACDSNCNCGRCNTKPGCNSEDQCLVTCNTQQAMLDFPVADRTDTPSSGVCAFPPFGL